MTRSPILTSQTIVKPANRRAGDLHSSLTASHDSRWPYRDGPHSSLRQTIALRPIALDRKLQRVLLIAANVALFSGVLWFVFAVANMSGTLDGVLDREMLSTVLADTSFGKVWIARLILTVVMIVVIWNRFESKSAPRSNVSVPVLTAALLLSLAGVGHSQLEEGFAARFT